MRNQLLIILLLAIGMYPLLGQLQFVEVGPSKNVTHQLLEGSLGSGISCFDFNQDGLDDLTLGSSFNQSVAFYENTGDGFRKLPSLINNLESVRQINWVDYDNDGDPDLYIAANDGVSRLYRNNGDLILEDVTESSGLPLNVHFGYGAAWGDYNRDGWLDLYYASKGVIGDPDAIRSYNRLFRNQANGTFVERTFEANAADDGKLPFCAAFLDYNNDMWPDIYIANDKLTYNTLLRNERGGMFVDVSVATGADARMNAMCVNPGDYNQDGYMDIYVTNTPIGSQYLENKGLDEGADYYRFENIAEDLNVHFPGGNCWGSNFLDADNDGDLDLYVSSSIEEPRELSSAFYENIAATHFDHKMLPGMENDVGSSYTNAIGDFNDDGLIDIVVQNNPPHPFFVWENQTTDAGNWLKVQLEGVVSNRDGVGSRIEAFADGIYQMQFTLCGSGYLGQNSGVKHFGLGMAETLDSLIITWSTGHRDVLKNISANQKLLIVEGSTSGGDIEIDEGLTFRARPMTTPTLDIEELASIVNVGPNPLSTHLEISSVESIQLLRLLDINGEVHFTLAPASSSFSLDLSLLPPGIYVLEVTLDHNRQGAMKLMKS